MSVKMEKEASLVKLTFDVSAEVIEEGLAYSFKKNKNKFNVHGFRAGKAPRKMVEQLYGVEVLFDDASYYIINKEYDAAIKELNLQPVSDPVDIKVPEMTQTSMTFTLDVYVKPEVTLGEYKNVEVANVSDEVTEEEIDAAIQEEAKKNSREISVDDRATQNGDTVVIDFVGSVDGVEFEGGSATNHSLELGSGQFIPGFEEQLVGKNLNEEVIVKVTFPEDYHSEELAGKDAEFKVTINGIKYFELPEINDEFASDVSEFETLDAYKEDIKNKLAESKAQTAKNQMHEEALRKVLDAAVVEIPACMIDSEVDSLVNRTESQFKMYGMTIEDFCNYSGKTVEEYKESLRPQAEINVKRDLVIEKIAEVEGFEVTEADKEAEYEKLAGYYRKSAEEVKAMFATHQDHLEYGIKLEKAEDAIYSTIVRV